jgi:Cu2+-exporting ATPase/Cu+-exporting ATPase
MTTTLVLENYLVTQTLCLHCSEPIITPYVQASDVFCCQGCLTVYNILHSKGLEDYYQIKQNAGTLRSRAPVELKAQKYLYLDQEEFLQEYSYKNHDDLITMEFFLEGIHCLACLWLIEQMPRILPLVASCQLQMDKSTATVSLYSGGAFSQVAREFSDWGYVPHALKNNQQAKKLKISEERQELLRMGIAAAGANNTMLYAVSIYAGAKGHYAEIFNLLTVLFSLPVLTYSAYPFYKNAYQSLKQKMPSIDLPISVSLLLGTLMGLFNLFAGIQDNYFDTLTTLVFLLLLSRYFLKKIQHRALAPVDMHYFYEQENVLRAKKNAPQEFEEIHSKFVSSGDCLKVLPNEFIPADALVVNGSSYINSSLLTGESTPHKVSAGEVVFAGTQNLSSELFITVTSLPKDSRVGKILQRVEREWKLNAPILEITNKVSRYFLWSILVCAVVLFFYQLHVQSLNVALKQALTLLIVTCPCALALAVPLTFTRSLSIASKNGIIIKNAQVLEKLERITHLFFDKTGTLTNGKLSLTSIITKAQEPLNYPIQDVIFTLEQYSKHPKAKALLDFCHKEKNAKVLSPLHHLKETPGVGVEAIIGNDHYSIDASGLWEKSVLKKEFIFADSTRAEAKEIMTSLKNNSYHISILSGDKTSVVEELAQSLNIASYKGDLSPEEKNIMIEKTPHSMMIGDGANDAIALTKAYVGVAVHGSVELSLRAADIYLTIPGITMIPKILVLSKETMKVIKRNLIFSLTYNALSIFAVFMGVISPLVAAVIMPLSSLTVLCSALYGTKKLRTLWK